jgi:hypothetical protein
MRRRRLRWRKWRRRRRRRRRTTGLPKEAVAQQLALVEVFEPQKKLQDGPCPRKGADSPCHRTFPPGGATGEGRRQRAERAPASSRHAP